jgi:probable rRNA maturation factor
MNEIFMTFEEEINRKKVVQRDIKNWIECVFEELKLKNKTCSVLFTGFKTIKKLNARYRNKNNVTDVLSFSQIEGTGISHDESFSKITPLGDIVICMPQAEIQAKKMHHSLKAEVQFLLLHGILHLLGNDHENDGGLMEKLERKIYKKLTGTMLVDAE